MVPPNGTPNPAEAVVVPTRSYDNSRTGANLREKTLTVDAVRASSGKFHKLFTLPVDEKIETFPLYVGGMPHDVVYVTTMNNSVYAFDAATGTELWHRNLGTAVSGAAFAKVKPFSVNTKFGIAATPVIDRDTSTMYVVRWAVEGATSNDVVQRLYALKLSDGTDAAPSVKVDATVTVGGATASFDHTAQIVRASLLLLRKKRADGGFDKAVVISAAGGESATSAHGWIVAYDVANLSNPPAAWCSSPKSGAAGIWMAGGGPSGDDDGNIWFATGNGRYDGINDFGESFVKLAWSPGRLDLVDSFTPFEDVNRDANHQDQDLGSAAPVLLPGTDIVAGGGKDGILYVMHRGAMGKQDFSKLVQAPFVASYIPTPGSDPVAHLDIISSHDPPTQSPVDGGHIHHIHSTPVFWNGMLYVWGENALLRALGFDGAHFDTTPLAKGNVTPSATAPGIGGMPGGMITLSANGTNDGIVWALHAIDGDANKAVVKGILRAYDAQSFTTNSDGSKAIVELWNSEMDANDPIGSGAKIVPPMVANGRVFAVTYDNQVNVYGLK
jgi:hypothetical protein